MLVSIGLTSLRVIDAPYSHRIPLTTHTNLPTFCIEARFLNDGWQAKTKCQ